MNATATWNNSDTSEFFRLRRMAPGKTWLHSEEAGAYVEERHLTKKFRDDLIKSLNQKAIESSQTFKIWGICGELSGTDIIEEGLRAERCAWIELYFGPKVKDEVTQIKLKNILCNDKYREQIRSKLRLYSLKERPEYHAISIGNVLIVEDYHPEKAPNEWVTVLPKPSVATLHAFFGQIANLRKEDGLLLDCDNIDQLKTYN